MITKILLPFQLVATVFSNEEVDGGSHLLPGLVSVHVPPIKHKFQSYLPSALKPRQKGKKRVVIAADNV